MADRPVYYFARIVPGYRVPILSRLDERLNGRLVVCSGQPPRGSSLGSLSSSSAPAYHQVPLRNLWFRNETLHAQPFRRAFRAYGPPAVVLAEESPRSVTLPLLLADARRRGAGTALWGHFSSNNRAFAPEAHAADRYRLWLARRADACVCYTDAIADLLRPYLPDERLFVARNTLDTDALFALRERLEREGRTAVRRRLGLADGAPVLIFIGRLIPEKGTGLLLDAFRALRAEAPAHLLVVGSGPEEAALRERTAREGLDGVRFLGAMPAWEDSAPFLYAADVMVMPGYLGLSVNHAFAFGLPVVSRTAPDGARFHSPEAAYVRPDENGLLAPPDDPDALAGAVRRVLAERERFSRNALAYAREHLTIDRMVDGLAAAVEHAQARAR